MLSSKFSGRTCSAPAVDIASNNACLGCALVIVQRDASHGFAQRLKVIIFRSLSICVLGDLLFLVLEAVLQSLSSFNDFWIALQHL
jgi:hypothetical protein